MNSLPTIPTLNVLASAPPLPAIQQAPKPVRLARSQMRAYAQKLHGMQKGICPLCLKPIDLRVKGEGVLDHDHMTGLMRGLLHRACNGMEGKVANAVGRWGGVGMSYPAILARLKLLVAYLEAKPHPHIYPFHKTDEELRVERLRKRRVSAAATRARAALSAQEGK